MLRMVQGREAHRRYSNDITDWCSWNELLVASKAHMGHYLKEEEVKKKNAASVKN